MKTRDQYLPEPLRRERELLAGFEKMSLAEQKAEFWRLQDAMEALPQVLYEGGKGERLMQEQTLLCQLVADACDDPHWFERVDARD